MEVRIQIYHNSEDGLPTKYHTRFFFEPEDLFEDTLGFLVGEALDKDLIQHSIRNWKTQKVPETPTS